MSDHIEQAARRLSSLDDEPVTAHPGVLDEVHAALVGELERLAGVVAGGAGPSTSGGRRA